MPDVAVIIPWSRSGASDDRRRALELVIRRYEHNMPRAEPIVAEFAGEPWCKAAPVAAAARSTTASILVVADADVWAPNITETVRDVRRAFAWGAPHATVRRLTQAATASWHHSGDGSREHAERVHLALLGGGIVVIRRDVFEACPLDPRFTGWGGEDVAWGYALKTLFPHFSRGHDELIHFWHVPQPRRSRSCGSVANERLRDRYRSVSGDPDGMRALLAEAL